jgi:hypothetical protein
MVMVPQDASESVAPCFHARNAQHEGTHINVSVVGSLIRPMQFKGEERMTNWKMVLKLFPPGIPPKILTIVLTLYGLCMGKKLRTMMKLKYKL